MNTNAKPRLIVVDDEPQVLNAIEDQMEGDFVVNAVTSAKAALELLHELKDVSVLLADQRMSGMTGDELFARASAIGDATRVIITGYADLEAVVRAVNRGRIFGYVTKPWDEAELRMMLHKADEHHRLVRELQHERDLLHNLMNNVRDEIYFKGRDHRFIRINWAAARGQGIPSPEAAIGRMEADFITDHVRLQRIKEEDQRMFDGGEPFEVDELRLRPDGTKCWMSKTKAPVCDPSGKVAAIVAIARDITNRKNLEIEILATRDQLRATLDAIPDPLFELSLDGRYHDYHSPRIDLLAAPPGTLLQRTVSEVLPPAAANVVLGALREAHDKGWSAGKEFELALPQGRLWFELSISRKTVAPGEDPRFICLSRDVTDRRQAELRIQRLNRVYAVLSGVNSMILRSRSREALFNETCRLAVDIGGFKLVYIRMADESGGVLLPVASVGPAELPISALAIVGAGSEDMRETNDTRAFLERTTQVCNDLASSALRLPFGDNGLEHGVVSAASLPLLSGERAIGTITFAAGEVGVFDSEEIRLLGDLAGNVAMALDRFEKSEQVDYLSYYDQLTGLANRTLFYQRLEQHLTGAARDRQQVALILLDIERFRVINDSIGRQGGDALLKQIAERMIQHSKERSWLARIGADQFAIFIPDMHSEDELARRNELRWQQVFGAPYRVGDTELRVSAKLGIALFPNDGESADLLFRNAEAALKKAKQRGERFLFFEQRMTERVTENLALENQLRNALDKEEFVLHYQPKVNLDARRIVGVEALIRWQSPELGLVPPGSFIPLMEETGLILEAGAWALRRAAIDHRRWLEQGLRAPRVAVNVSAIQLRKKDFVDTVRDAIRAGIGPAGIDLEITESLVMEDIESNIEKLKAVRELGVSIAIDDFGTGYSSLGYLAKLPVQALKIDRSFIITMLNDPDTMTLVQTMISLAHSLRLKVIAEGVDAEDQAKFLRLLRCDEMQGYLYSKPISFDHLTKMLESASGGEPPRGIEPDA